MNKIWQDKHLMRVFWIGLSLLIFLFVIMQFIFVSKNLHNFEFILALILLIIPLVILINILRVKLSYITIDGIRLGNAPNDMYGSTIKLKPTIFLRWNLIKDMRIKEKIIRRTFSMDSNEFLIIRTKSRDTYKCFIADPKGFVKTIKRLNKTQLLAKDSKYLYERTK